MAVLGVPPPERVELGRIEDRWSFVYLERCTVHRDANAITATDQEGVIHIPVAVLGCLLLGPGARITHGAMSLLGDCGASVVWVGENGVRYYAHGRSLAKSSRLLETQARLVSNNRSRLEVARTMYLWRFPGEDVEGLTMQQLRGKEGARVRRIYREEAARVGIEWEKRDYDRDDIAAGDQVNQALTAANASLYGIVHSVIVALGCSPGLGFIHSGTDRAFVYDIADLYKAAVSIPAAFEAAASPETNLLSQVRRKVRDAVVSERLLKTCARDILRLLQADSQDVWDQDDSLSLWSGRGDETVESGRNYAGDEL